MNEQQIRRQFEQLVSQQDADIPLDQAALLIAAESRQDLQIDRYLTYLDEAAERFERRQKSLKGIGVPVEALIHHIHQQEGFSGNINHYYEPQNSYLSHVIDSKTGIPVTLALIHICIGRRLNIPVEGISFPGHFLVRYGFEQHLFVDPFGGRILSEADCGILFKQVAGPTAKLKPEYFEAASNRSILLRILDNLKQIFWRNRDWGNSKACLERQLLLLPDQTEYSIQLGAVYEMQGNIELAELTYVRVLTNTPDDQIKDIASKRLLALVSNNRPTIH